ncbi:hypothetical protein F5Y14DRAFT_448469 [Nemania sp. NC0429]|nr:hypothetical protein F5Y14DRAFT_448469 [Nemania sp. NC0429]
MAPLAASGKFLAAENITEAAAPSTDPFHYSSPLQNVAIFTTIAFAALALVVVCTRLAGRLSSRQLGLGKERMDPVFEKDTVNTGNSSHLFVFVSDYCDGAVLGACADLFKVIKTNFIGIRWQDIPPHDPLPGLIWNYAVAILYNPILALAKTSILLLLLRLFWQKPGVKRFIVYMNAANIGMMIAVLLATVVQCIPIQKTWQPSLAGVCIDRKILFTTLSSFNIFTDILILAVPLSIFIGLRIPRRSKIALMLVFLLGFFTTAASIVRLYLLIQGLFERKLSLSTDAEVGFVTSAIETNLALVTASAPALRPLLRAWFPKLLRVHRDEFMGNTGRRVMGGAATRMTRLRSQTEVRSQDPPESDEATATSSSIIKNNDAIGHVNNAGPDKIRPDPATRSEANTDGQPLERWI